MLPPAVPRGWQGPMYLSQYLLFPKVCISKKLESEVEPGAIGWGQNPESLWELRLEEKRTLANEVARGGMWNRKQDYNLHVTVALETRRQKGWSGCSKIQLKQILPNPSPPKESSLILKIQHLRLHWQTLLLSKVPCSATGQNLSCQGGQKGHTFSLIASCPPRFHSGSSIKMRRLEIFC